MPCLTGWSARSSFDAQLDKYFPVSDFSSACFWSFVKVENVLNVYIYIYWMYMYFDLAFDGNFEWLRLMAKSQKAQDKPSPFHWTTQWLHTHYILRFLTLFVFSMCFLKALKRVSRPLFSIFFLWILPLCHVSKYIEVQPRGASHIFAKAEWRVRTIVRLRWTIWTGNELAMNSHWTGNGLATSKVIWQWKAEIKQRSRDGTQGTRRKLESFRAKRIGPRGPQMRPNPMHTWAHYK